SPRYHYRQILNLRIALSGSIRKTPVIASRYFCGAPFRLPMPNQNPEQKARDTIDEMLRAAGWAVQEKSKIDFHSCGGQAIREYVTESGPADYVLFVDKKPVGVIEAKKETLGQNITTVEDQTKDYAGAKLKWIQAS